jgi:predicted MFS family arabinose efflux permease
VQGIGAGGLVVTASALIGEVIPLRERGRYQGALGAVFGVTTVVGPLLGGVFTDDLSWRWAFYVNIPIAILVVILAARTIPAQITSARSNIDYRGVPFIALGASGLTLATSWGGSQYAWASPTIVGLFAASALSLMIFVWVELRAPEPILPIRLFRSRVFSVASVLSFIVGFAMLGALTFLPSYLQYVGGASATMSGVRTLPMVVGLLLTSVASGQVVSSTGIYKPFPIAGAIFIGIGLFLLSRMNEHTSVAAQSAYMFVLGAGIGLAMQVLTIVVQNTVEFRDLGSATSGVTFFRTLGSSFGASIMGTIYASQLDSRVPLALVQAHVDPSSARSPSAVQQLTEPARAIIVHAYSQSLHTVFLWSVPVAVVGLAIALALPQVALRGAAREAARSAGEGFGMPAGPDADSSLEVLVSRTLRRNPGAAGAVMAHVRADLGIPTAWGLINVNVREKALGAPTRQADIEDRLRVPHGVLTSFFDEIVQEGYLTRTGDQLELTEGGSLAVKAVVDAWAAWLSEELSSPVEDERVRAALQRIARRILVEEPRGPRLSESATLTSV